MTEHELALASELREPFSPLIRPVLEVLRVCKLVSLLRRKPRESAAQPDPPVAEGRDVADADDAAADADMLIPPPASAPSDAAAADPAVASDASWWLRFSTKALVRCIRLLGQRWFWSRALFPTSRCFFDVASNDFDG